MKITLRAARVNAGLSREEVAAKLAVNVSTVASWEAWKTKPSLDNFKRLCQLYEWPEDGIRFE